MYQYASEYEWGYTVHENDVNKLIEAIKHLYHDTGLREKLGSKGQLMALKYHDSEKIRENFKVLLSNAVKEHSKNVLSK